MKKSIVFCLTWLLALSLVACSSTPDETDGTEKPTVSETVATTEAASESAEAPTDTEQTPERSTEREPETYPEIEWDAEGEVRDLVVITEIYDDYFLAMNPEKTKTIKLKGVLRGNRCVGDELAVVFQNGFWNEEANRWEADLIDAYGADEDAKPVIYLYPETETEVSVKLTLDGRLTCTYPAYNGGWTVTASPDGTLTDKNGQIYNYLYWEGLSVTKWDMTRGFCVKGEDTAAFLEDALAKLGLTRREANEFIVYWLPIMQENPYNIISFQTDLYTESAKLEIAPAPDTLIRVFMAFEASECFVELEPQELTAPERVGFTVVEWGGSEIKEK